MITGAADPRALDGQLRSREEALRQVTRDEAAVVLACERLDHARHALGLLHVLAARLAALLAEVLRRRLAAGAPRALITGLRYGSLDDVKRGTAAVRELMRPELSQWFGNEYTSLMGTTTQVLEL